MANSDQFQINQKVHAEVIAHFRERAAILRQYSMIIIILIIIVLVAGISLFLFAGQIANNESNPALQARRANLTALDSEVSRLRSEIDRREEALRGLTSRYEAELTEKSRTDIQRGALIQLYSSSIEKARQEQKVAAEKLLSLEQERGSLWQELVKAEVAASERSGLSQIQLPVLASAFVTRLGAVVLLLFLVKILVPLYRYSMKLSSYYDARADAFTIISTNYAQGVTGNKGADGARTPTLALASVDTIERLVAALSPDCIDFGKAPSTPSESALRFAKDIITSQRK